MKDIVILRPDDTIEIKDVNDVVTIEYLDEYEKTYEPDGRD